MQGQLNSIFSYLNLRGTGPNQYMDYSLYLSINHEMYYSCFKGMQSNSLKLSIVVRKIYLLFFGSLMKFIILFYVY